MKEFLVGLIISYIMVATLCIWLIVITTGFMLIFTPLSFMYVLSPIIGFLCIVSVIRHGLKLIGKITDNGKI
jgi:hypothetical protein